MRSAIVTVLVASAMAFAAIAADEVTVTRLLNDNSCSGCDLRGANLRGAELSGAGLANANLAGADLRKAILLGAVFSGADLRGADLSEALLEDARFGNANLANADLRGARIGGADLSEAVGLTQGQLDVACADAAGRPFATKVPKGMTVRFCRHPQR